MTVTKVTGMMQTSTKGGDISSASPCVIDTDGDVFDVSGSTSFAAFTVVAGRRFTLNFDSVLTMTHHASTLDLPAGGANITTAAGDVAEFFATGTNTVQCVNYTRADGTAVVSSAGGKIVQVVNTITGAVATGTTQTALDDSKPQVGDGDQYLSLAISPTNTNNKLFFEIVLCLANSNTGAHTAALIQDTDSDSLAAISEYNPTAGTMVNLKFNHYMTAPGTSTYTYKVRSGFNAAGTTTLNGIGAARSLGGVMASSMTISEIEV